MESPTPDKGKKRWVHILLWSLADLLLVIPVLIVLWFFGQMIDKKKNDTAPDESSALYYEMDDPWGEDLLTGGSI